MTCTEIRRIVCDKIIYALKDDLENGEAIMKEAREQMDTDADLKTAEGEMRRVIKTIEAVKRGR